MWEFTILHFDLYFLLANFFLYSFFGWIYESSYVSAKNKCFVNRGFLNGPLIPIYGVGATLIYVILYPIRDNILYVFVGGAILATVLELITSYVMEKLFHTKWWDYSNFKFNLQGRVCLMVSLFWGVLAILMTQLLQPLMNNLIFIVPLKIGKYVIVLVSALFLIDLILTIVSTAQLDKKLTSLHKLRLELVEYFERTKLFDTTEGLKAKFEDSFLGDFVDGFKDKMEENLEKYAQKYGTKDLFDRKKMLEEFSDKIKSYKNKYYKNAKREHIVQKRLLKAFPNLKAIDREDALEELKKKLFPKKK